MALTDPRRDQRRAPGRAEEVTTGFEPDDPPPLDWVVLTTWVVGLALSIAVYALAGYALVAIIGGCATGRVGNDGEIHGFAIGEGAKLERCASFPVGEPTGLGLIAAPINTTCPRIEGGPILPSIISIIGSALSGAVQFIGALWGPAAL